MAHGGVHRQPFRIVGVFVSRQAAEDRLAQGPKKADAEVGHYIEAKPTSGVEASFASFMGL